MPEIRTSQKYDLKVLYCEDDEKSLASMRKVLQKRFAELIIAKDGEQGYTKYKQYKPDLIITDIKMPNLSGLNMIRKIREEDKQIKIIIVSAYTDVNYFLEAIDYGINAFIKKPVSFKILDEYLEEITHEIFLQKKIEETEAKRNAIQNEHEILFREIKQDLSLARSVQEYLLPEWLLISDNLVFSTAYKPSLEVGGDLFGYFPVNPVKYIFYLGDVSGHGLKSAMLMMAAYSTINMLIDQQKPDISPAVIVNRLNKVLSQYLFQDNNYMTLVLGTIDIETNEVRYIRAGHPELIILDHSLAEAQLIHNERGNIPVGWLQNYVYSEADEMSFKLQNNQTVFIYSDGLFECSLPDGSPLGQEALIEEINDKIPHTHPLTSPLEFMEYLKSKNYNIRQDDFTMVSFFLPTYQTIPGLKEYFQADIPEDLELNDIMCSEFLLRITSDKVFANTFEKDINTMFHSELFVQQISFITGFILLLAYQNDNIECHFWMKASSEIIASSHDTNLSLQLNQETLLKEIHSFDIYKTGYLVDVEFKTLGEILQVICHLDPAKKKLSLETEKRAFMEHGLSG